MGTALWEKRLRGVFITFERQRNTGNNEKLKREEKQYDESWKRILCMILAGVMLFSTGVVTQAAPAQTAEIDSIEGLDQYLSKNQDGTISLDESAAQDAGYTQEAIAYVQENISYMNDMARTKGAYIVSAKYSCGFPDPQVLPIIVADRYLDYFTTIMEDRLWQVLAKPVFQWRNRSGLSMNAAKAA